MRLLQLKGNDELHLVEFGGTDVPPYAILSHTWGVDDSEVTYQDIIDGTGKKKAGYKKILFCGREAAKYKRLRYFWVDTCCINKTSSAELSEAINSMYRWYREAKICFIYLEDVSPVMKISEWSKSNIRWFTRGWTLQELVASREVEFYAGDWTFLGTKSNHLKVLSSITGIHESALNGRAIEEFSIAQRMSWASKRTTTRPEDAAYCLLGLFDVNMPLLYGEGLRKAFVRLQEEIMKDSSDHSIFAWIQTSADPTQSHGLLASSPADFAFSGDIVSIYDISKSNPYSVTNSGLRITLPMKFATPWDASKRKLRIGLLNCVTTKKPVRLITLRLYHFRDYGDQFSRVGVNEMKYEHPTQSKYSPETIYVRNQFNLGWKVSRSIIQNSELDVSYISIFYGQARSILSELGNHGDIWKIGDQLPALEQTTHQKEGLLVTPYYYWQERLSPGVFERLLTIITICFGLASLVPGAVLIARILSPLPWNVVYFFTIPANLYYLRRVWLQHRTRDISLKSIP